MFLHGDGATMIRCRPSRRAVHSLPIIFGAASALVVEACGLAAPSSLTDVPFEIRTESEYPLRSVDSRFEVLIEFTLASTGDGVAYVPTNCLGEYEIQLQSLAGEAWTSTIPFYGRVIADCGEGDRIELRDGGLHYGSLSLVSLPGVTLDDVAGSYRLVIPEVVSGSGSDVGPIESDAFDLETPR